jgi:hypothetical protein
MLPRVNLTNGQVRLSFWFVPIDEHVLPARLFHFNTANEDVFDLVENSNGSPLQTTRFASRPAAASRCDRCQKFSRREGDCLQGIIMRHA